MLNDLSDRLRAAAHRIKVRMRFSNPSASTVNQHRVVNPWSAVSIKPSLVDVCPAARALRDRRFLSREAPQLPLPNCTLRHKCACHFLHHADRRTDARRAHDHGLPPRYFAGKEQRITMHGRRSTDN